MDEWSVYLDQASREVQVSDLASNMPIQYK